MGGGGGAGGISHLQEFLGSLSKLTFFWVYRNSRYFLGYCKYRG